MRHAGTGIHADRLRAALIVVCGAPGCGDGSPHISSVTRTPSRWRGRVPLIVIQRQLGHINLGISSIYLQGIDSTEIIYAVHARRPPMVPVDHAPLLTAWRIAFWSSSEPRRGCDRRWCTRRVALNR
jgi:hypothetical protein